MTTEEQRNVELAPTIRTLCFLVVAGLVAACAQPDAVDLDAAREEVLAADVAWSKTPPDPARFAEFFVENGRFMPPDAPEAEGRDEILAAASQVFGAPGSSLEWSPSAAQVAPSGDQGYSMGTYTQMLGSPVPGRIEGKYLTLWERDNQERWRVVVDIFNANAPLQTTTSAGEAAFFIAQYGVHDEAMYGEYLKAFSSAFIPPPHYVAHYGTTSFT